MCSILVIRSDLCASLSALRRSFWPGRRTPRRRRARRRLRRSRSTSSPGASQSTSQDDREDRDNRDGPHWELPVSLDRIREGLERLPAKPLLGSIDIQADFRVSIEERRHLELMIERLAIEPTPSPPGGLYYYEIQRLVRNPVDHPLEQPYAAFSPGELVQVAATSILSRLLTQHGAQGFQSISRGAAERPPRRRCVARSRPTAPPSRRRRTSRSARPRSCPDGRARALHGCERMSSDFPGAAGWLPRRSSSRSSRWPARLRHPHSTSARTRSSTRISISRSCRPSTSTSTSTRRSAKAVADRRAHGRALARAARASAGPRAQRPPAARALRLASRLRTDQHDPGRARRRHRRRHRAAAPPDHPAVRRDRWPRPIT